MLPPITYNRSTKQYEVAYSKRGSATFPTKDEATRFAVTAADRRIAQAVTNLSQKWPDLSERAWRAAQIFLAGSVSQTSSGFTVKSQKGTETYHIDSQLHACSCPDCTDGRAPHGPGNRRWCKHMLACSLSIRFPRQDHILTNHRGRSVQQSFIHVPAGHYQNGRPIEPNLINYAATFRSSTGRPPADKEKLLSWIYR